MGKKGLGRGLDALIAPGGEGGLEVSELNVELIKARPGQPRTRFDEEGMQELVNSVREHGVLQPILVRPVGEDMYEVVAGERRLRAARIAGLERIPVVVRDMGDREASELALIENLQREDLNPVEEAVAFREMMERFGYTQEKLAERIGKSRSYVANALRLLNLCSEVLSMVEKGELTAGHARSILGVARDETEQIKMAQHIVRFGLSVRDIEVTGKRRSRKQEQKEAELADIEEKLQERLGTKTNIVRKRRGGKIEIFFYSEEELMRILDMIVPAE